VRDLRDLTRQPVMSPGRRT